MSKTGLFIIILILFLCLPLASGCQQTPPPPPSELKVELLGDSHTLLVDSEGKLTAGAELTSADGSVGLTITKGTRILDKDKNTLQLIQVEIDPTLPLSPEGAYIMGVVYDLKPYGAIFSFPLQLTLKYNADELPDGAKESTICIASYENNKWSVVSLQKTDTKAQMVTAQISRLVRAAVIVSQALQSTETFPKPPTTSASVSPLAQALSSGKPTLAEFGSSTCIPCKQMKPILEELAIEYEGKVNVVIVEVYEQMALTRQYSIMAIPTQIIFDSNGKEITRHMGFWAKKDIIAQLNKMGVE
jgi:thioredoxin 1